MWIGADFCKVWYCLVYIETIKNFAHTCPPPLFFSKTYFCCPSILEKERWREGGAVKFYKYLSPPPLKAQMFGFTFHFLFLEIFSENRQLLSKPSRPLELAFSIHHHPSSPLQTGRNILPCRSRHHNPANPSQQVNRRSDRQLKPKNDERKG